MLHRMNMNRFVTAALLLSLASPSAARSAERNRSSGNRGNSGSSGVKSIFDTAAPPRRTTPTRPAPSNPFIQGELGPRTPRPSNNSNQNLINGLRITNEILNALPKNSSPPQNNFPGRNVVPNPGQRFVTPNTPQFVPGSFAPSTPQNVIVNQPALNEPLPRNVLPPAAPTPSRNFVMGSLPAAGADMRLTGEQAEQAASQLDQQVNEQIDEFDQENSGPEAGLEEFQKAANDPATGLTEEQKKQVNEAIASGDPAKVEQAALNSGVPAEKAKILGAAQAEKNRKEELIQAVKGGASAQEVAEKSNAYLQAKQSRVDQMVNAGLMPQAAGQNIMDNAAGALDDVVANRAGADALRDIANGNLVTAGGGSLPTGPVMTTWLPDLPAGQVFAVDSQFVFVGTGEGGDLTSGVMSPAEAGLPVVDGPAVPNANGDDAAGNVILKNPAANNGPVAYLLDGQSFKMEPGYSQTLAARSWTISFDRGGDFGEARYTLSTGNYEFTQGERGWDIVSKPVKVTLDNVANPYDFHFVFNNQQRTVKARETLELSDASGVRIQYDSGNGTPRNKKLEAGVYSIAVDPATRQLDVFVGKAIPEIPEAAPVKDFGEKALAATDFKKTTTPAPASETAPSPEGKATASVPKATKAPRVMQPPKRLQRRNAAGS